MESEMKENGGYQKLREDIDEENGDIGQRLKI
jgi:hypothetical protein